MLLDLLFMAAGLMLLVGGANVLVRGVSALAQAVGVPPLAIGLTVVAFGTSAPELVLNATAATRGQTELAFGSIIGSCTVNIGWVLALTAVVRPLRVEPSIITREMPMMLLATAAFTVLGIDRVLNAAGDSALVRGDGIMLLLLFTVFVYYTVRVIRGLPRAQRHHDPLVEELQENLQRKKPMPLWLSLLLTVAGLAVVALGGRLTVQGAVHLAGELGMSPALIGLTIVSFGTTLPELVTGIVATRRGESDIAVGNIVGSNIFNLLFVGGVVSSIHPIGVPQGGSFDLILLGGLSALLLPMALRGGKISRTEGVALLAIYFTYTTWRVAAEAAS